MASSSAQEASEDVAEAKRLLSAARRPALKELLSKFIEEGVERELKELSAAEPKGEEVPEAADLLESAPLKKVDEAIAAPPPTKLVVPAAPSQDHLEWVTPSYGWEQGEYNTPWVNVMASISGATRDKVTCEFGQDSFDLRVVGAGGKNYRLFVDTLEKDIVADESKFVVKKNRVTIKLKKVKGEYSYDHWNDLKKKGGKLAKEKEKNKDPSAGIMDMMKDLYDTGDDNMRKIIGESMMKSRNGEKLDDPSPGIGGGGSKFDDSKLPDFSKDMDFTKGMPDLDLPDEPEEVQ